MEKLIKIQAFARMFIIRKKYLLKSPYRTKETETYRYFKDNGSDIRSIKFGSDIMNGGGVSNGAYSVGITIKKQQIPNLNLLVQNQIIKKRQL